MRGRKCHARRRRGVRETVGHGPLGAVRYSVTEAVDGNWWGRRCFISASPLSF